MKFNQERQDLTDTLYECEYAAQSMGITQWASEAAKLREEVEVGDHDGAYEAIRSTIYHMKWNLGGEANRRWRRIEGSNSEREKHLNNKRPFMELAREALESGSIGHRDRKEVAKGFHMWELIGVRHPEIPTIRAEFTGVLWRPLWEFIEDGSYGNRQTEKWRNTLQFKRAREIILNFGLISPKIQNY